MSNTITADPRLRLVKKLAVPPTMGGGGDIKEGKREGEWGGFLSISGTGWGGGGPHITAIDRTVGQPPRMDNRIVPGTHTHK